MPSFKKTKNSITTGATTPILGICPKESKVETQRDISTPIFMEALFTKAKKCGSAHISGTLTCNITTWVPL